jgi:hypothetical protein
VAHLALPAEAIVIDRPPAILRESLVEAVDVALELRPGWAWTMVALFGQVGVWLARHSTGDWEMEIKDRHFVTSPGRMPPTPPKSTPKIDRSTPATPRSVLG